MDTQYVQDTAKDKSTCAVNIIIFTFCHWIKKQMLHYRGNR